MPCFKPLTAYRSNWFTKDKSSITFSAKHGIPGSKLMLPCGRCIGCKLERARQWAVRCVHEASLHEFNCFITLTYSDEFLPEKNSLIKSDFQLFMKKLRNNYLDSKIRFYACGEYGDKFSRPHYHACLFGFDFPDKVLFKDGEQKLWISESLSSIWGKGFCTIGSVTFDSAAYVARYITKKLTGPKSIEYGDRIPEFTLMSRRPGIGSQWFEKYASDVYPSDEVILKGRSMKPPRFYDSRFELSDPLMLEELKANRLEKGKAKYLGLTNQEIWRRFKRQAKVQLSKMSLKRR